MLNPLQKSLLLRDDGAPNLGKHCDRISVPIIQPHYRLGAEHQYPGPVHDAAVAYQGAIDWLRTFNEKRAQQHENHDAAEQQHSQLKIGLTGELVGGSLAVALGLTECRITDPARVVAVSVREPILDWVFEHDTSLQRDATTAFEEGHESDLKQKHQREDIVDAFHLLRHRSFPGRYPYRYFDPFASPLHFLRSPSGRLPSSGPESSFAGFEDADEDASDADEAEEEETARIVGAPQLTPSLPTSPSADRNASSSQTSLSYSPTSAPKRRMAPNDPRRFKRPLRYPTADNASSMILPRIQVITDTNTLLRPQAEEFVRLLRRGLLRGKGYKMSKNIDKLVMDENALVAEQQKQNADEFRDERLALLRVGMRQFQLDVEQANEGDEKKLARWFLDR